MRRFSILCLGLFAVAAVCGWLFLRPCAVSRALTEKARHGPGTTVDFMAIAPFPWDRVYVFGPYTPHERIQESLGFQWPSVKRTTIASNDGLNLVVFVKAGGVVHWFEHPRHLELSDLAGAAGYAPHEARFQVCLVGPEQRLTLTSLPKVGN